MRNIGGRITPGLLEQLGLLGRIGEVAGEVAGGGEEWQRRQECPRSRRTSSKVSVAFDHEIESAHAHVNPPQSELIVGITDCFVLELRVTIST